LLVRHIHFGFLFVLVSATAWGLEIPVRRGGPGGASVGYVDMELVFREYPEAKKAREEYRTELLRQKSELAQREQVLDDLKREIELLKRSVETGPTVDRSSSTVVPIAPPETGSSDAPPAFGVFPVSSTGTVLTAPPLSGPAVEPVRVAPPSPSTAVASSQAEISKREEILLKRQKELEDARASSAKSLKIFEASRAKTILGRLYKALVELANERGISLVVDKSAILYGENTIDLTDSLNRRVRGLPAENP
jgi:Skp family chaperone for outer membrane proteins